MLQQWKYEEKTKENYCCIHKASSYNARQNQKYSSPPIFKLYLIRVSEHTYRRGSYKNNQKNQKEKYIMSKYSETRNLGRVASEDPIELYDFDKIALSLHLVEKNMSPDCVNRYA